MKGFHRISRLPYHVSVLFVVAALGAQVCEAAIYFVSQTGSDNYTCFESQSSSTPRRTINAGLSCLASGDTLQIGPGTYEESIFSMGGNLVPNGSPTAYTRIVGTPGKVFLAPLRSALDPGIYLGGGSSYVEFDGIGTDGINQNPRIPGCCGLALDGAYPGAVHHIRLLNGEFRNNKCGSIGFSRASDIEITGNYIHGDECYSFFSHGLYVGDDTERFLIANNVIEGFTDYGMQFYSSTGRTASDSFVRNNLIINNGSVAFGGGGISIGGANNRVENNVVAGNTNGIRIQYSSPVNVQLSGNKVVSNTFGSLYVDDSASNSIVTDSLLYNNGLNTVEDHGWATVQFNNVITNVDIPTINDFLPWALDAPSSPSQVNVPTQPNVPTQLNAPTGLAAQCTSDGHGVTLRWDSASGAQNYYLRVDYVRNNINDVWYVTGGLDMFLDAYPNTTFTMNVVPSENYIWWVHGANSSVGIGPLSSGTFTCVPQE